MASDRTRATLGNCFTRKLLPKLISGEVRVPEAARLVEVAGG
jgi:hypothetical protein